MSPFRRLSAIALSASLLGGPARAELGASGATIASDGSRMNARVTSTPMGAYVRHDLLRSNGGMVHELMNSEGRIFAVTWSGPGKPDLKALLGSHFDAFQSAGRSTARTMRSLRRPVQVNQPDLQIETAGHMGWFSGVAWLPSLAPATFSPRDLPQDR